MEPNQIRKILISDVEYPQSLKEIPDPPPVLYWRGNLNLNKKAVLAVVGTRRCSEYGKQITLEIVGDLVQAGFIIVSGMAKGIDTFSHLACLERKGKTVAVLGSSLDQESIYPKENLKLMEKIIESGGAVISEFPPKTPAFKQNFPRRNRIIAGLALGVLVIEAKEKSGALITANLAFLQKKKVFAVPGPVHSLNSKGPHYLIKRGAKLVETAQDILEEFNFRLKKEKQELKGETLEENLILKILKERPLHIDKIIEKTKLSAQVINSTLAILEIKGKVRDLGGNIFGLKL